MPASLKRLRYENSMPILSNKIHKSDGEKLTQLNDLNFDCLIKIFDPLSSTDLMNYIDYDFSLVDAARYIFKKKFANKLFHISNIPYFNEKGELRTVKFLEAFGSVIKNLHLTYNHDYNEYDKLIESSIIKNCRKSLEKIMVENANRHSMMNITESFVTIQKVEFISNEFGELILNFSKWFPNAYSLKLTQQVHQTSEYRKILERHHPALRHFAIQNVKSPDLNIGIIEKRIDNDNLIKFIQLNPQLTSLSITCDNPFEHINGITFNKVLLAQIKLNLKDLDELSIINEYGIITQTTKTHFDKLKTLKIHVSNIMSAINFPISFDNLDLLQFGCASYHPLEFNGFIDCCKNVKKLNLENEMIWTPWYIDPIIKMPMLEELLFGIDEADFNLDLIKRYVIKMLTKCKSLKVLKFFICHRKIENESKINELLQKFANIIKSEWQMKISPYTVKYILVELEKINREQQQADTE